MGNVEQSLQPPGADGDPLVSQVMVTPNLLRFVISLERQPKGLWRAEVVNALREELAIMEGKLRAPVTLKGLPPDLPMPSALVGVISADDVPLAVAEWNHALLRAFRNLSMAHGIPMPRKIGVVQVAS